MMSTDLTPVQEAIDKGHMELARNLLRVQIEDDPENADVWYWAARVAVNEAQRKAFLDKAVTLDPLHHRAANALRAIAQGEDAFPKPKPPIVRPQPVQPKQATEKPKIAYARFGRRGVATIIDFFIVAIAASPIVAIMLAGTLSTTTINVQTLTNDAALFAVLISLMNIVQGIYYGYFLSRQNGQTLGKRIMKVRVVKLDGTSLTIWEAILRNVIGYQLSNLVPGVGFLWALIDGERRTWHDMVVETRVIDV